MKKFTEWYEEMTKKPQLTPQPKKDDNSFIIKAGEIKSGAGHQKPSFRTGAHKQKKDGKGNRSAKIDKAIKDSY